MIVRFRRVWHGSATVLVALVLCGVLLPARAMAQNARWAIFVMKVDGSQVRRLAQVDGCTLHVAPRFSHDGKRVVFDANAGSRAGGGVYLVNVDGSGLTRIGEHARAVWSPDDKQIASVVYPPGSPATIHVQNLDGEGRTEIVAGTSVSWSPDGSRLAVSQNDNLLVIDLVSGESHAIFASLPADLFRGFTWFPDGKRLAVAVRPEPRKHRQLLFVPAEGDDQPVHVRLENELGGCVSFSPDGKKLAFDNQYKIHIVEVDGTSEPVLVKGQKGANLDPDWSPDGEWIVFASSRGEP